jgi:TonB family protein
MTLLLGLAIRCSVVLAAGLLLSACLKQRSAALRHRVLAASLLAAVLVVPLSLAVPRWNIQLPVALIDPGPAEAPALDPGRVAAGTPAKESAPGTPHPDAPRRTPWHPSAPRMLVLLWLAGAAGFVGVLIAGLVRLGRLAVRAVRVTDASWLPVLDTVASRYGLSREVQLCRTDSPTMLGTWGILRPQVLLPRHALDWPLDRVRVVLAHELAHVRRQDWLVQMGAEMLRALLWFNPLAWIVCARLRRESEQACDDEVLGMDVGGREYAVHLIELVRRCRRPVSPWIPALPMAHPSTLERRIVAMLNPRLDRRAPSRPALAALGTALVLITLPIAAVRAGQAGPAPLTGTVYDVTGAVVPGAEVSLTDANDVTTTTITTATGRFQFAAVAPGTYVLQARLVGFRTMRQEVELRTAGDWARAITLQVGGLSESVSVQATRLAASPRQTPGFAPLAPVRVGGNIRPPRKEHTVNPIYPVSMREAGHTGIVLVDAIIGTDGAVSSVRVLSAQAHPDLAIAAVDAVRQWQFTPTLLNGVAVEVLMTVTVRFDLDG